MTILVTGAKGMIGSQLVKGLLAAGYTVVGIDRSSDTSCGGQYFHHMCDLNDKDRLQIIFDNYKIDRIIHLAALAHATGGKSMPYELYHHLNVECANNIFQMAKERDIPILFISTVDVYGFVKGTVDGNTECNPITFYGKTKRQAELNLCSCGARYNIFRFSPVYTKEVKRDIQKRIYLKYPKIAYQIGKNTQYEVLDINEAVRNMVEWCSADPDNTIKVIKDKNLLNTVDYIAAEKAEGRANTVIRIPRWMVVAGYSVLRISGKNKFTFLINKAVSPLRSRDYVEE
ncbi:MAG: NAD(P)-dependent oxidoreductase [Clostridiaceae bacterium]|nr:NAD(P)-dependent oxidoreductase [Clostridiaceae bacterium]